MKTKIEAIQPEVQRLGSKYAVPLLPRKGIKMSKAEVNKKYCGKYVEITKSYDHIKKCYQYNVLKSYGKIRENTTLGEDVGTPMEYCR